MAHMHGFGTGVLVALLASPVSAQEAGKGDSLSPAMLQGPGLHETGRIGDVSPQPPPPAGAAISPAATVVDSNEKSIRRMAAAVRVPPPPPVGTIDPGALQAEIDLRFAALDDCRIDVARRHRVAPAEILADTVTLRWTIQPQGDIAATEVVATTPIDLDVMDCVKGAMRTWTFTRPRGGPVPVERAFQFRTTSLSPGSIRHARP